MERPSWAPAEVDVDRASAARMYDYYLGGSHNFAADRDMAQQAIEILPELPQNMRTNRAFLRRAVRFLVDAGVRQFLDIGSGIPTAGNVHEVAQRASPDVRVVYVDSDPVAVAHSRAILAGDESTGVVQADLRQPDQVLSDPELRRLLDLDKPIAVLMAAVLHFVPDADDPRALVERYRQAIAPGSYLVLSHGTDEDLPDESSRMLALYARSASPLTARSRAEVTDLLSGFELVEPGVVYLPFWRPDSSEDIEDHPERCAAFAAVGRKA